MIGNRRGSRWIIVVALAALLGLLLLTLGSVHAAEEGPREGHFTAPDIPLNASASNFGTASVSPGIYQTSEYMIGSVAVGLILPESDGTIDANVSDWTSDQRRRVMDQVKQGLEWWSRQAPAAHLTFVIDDHATTPIITGYEPIAHTQSEEGLWIGDVLTQIGYTGNSYWSKVRSYVNSLRETYHTDWAFAIFVVNSRGDSDAAFADHYFAYAYVGGPFLVMTYDNAGYGIDHMAAVTAHEMGHIFRALDQYASANISCAAQSGYLGIETQNSQRPGCASDVPSIMRGGVYPFTIDAIDPYARGQVGWRDSDGDGIFDPVDTIPVLMLMTPTQSGTEWTYAGRATDVPYPSPLRPAVTINDVLVESSVDGGPWTPAQPVDGRFDSPDEAFSLDLVMTAAGNYHVMIRARNSAGGVSDVASFNAVIPDPIDGGLDTRLEPPVAGMPGGGRSTVVRGEASSLNADGTPGPAVTRVEYRVDGGAWQAARPQDGAFDSADEAFTVPLALHSGTYLVEARAIDVTGKIEQHLASQSITIDRYGVFIPLIQK